MLTENEIGTIVIGCALSVHKELGPGLLEGVYEVVLSHELKQEGLVVERQVPVPLNYKGLKLDVGFRADIVINRSVLLELKSVEAAAPVHKKQVQTYLKLTGYRLGYLLNFGESLMKNGITRCVRDLPS